MRAGSSRKRAISAAFKLGHAPRVPGAIDTHLAREAAHELQHLHPFRKDDDLTRGFFQKLAQHAFELFELRADAAFGIEYGRRVANHPHAGEILLQALELLLGERPAPRHGGEPLGQIFIIAVPLSLLLSRGNAERLLRAIRQLVLHVALPPAQHDAGEAPVHLIQILVTFRTSVLVEVVEVAVETKQWAEDFGVEILHDGIGLVDAVLERRPARTKA